MNLPPRGYNQLRKGRLSLPEQFYFVTKKTWQRLPENENPYNGILLQPGVPEIILKSMSFLETQQALLVLAYVIMPDHLHLLIKLGETKTLSQVLKSFFGYSSHEINKVLVGQEKLKNSIWQDGYHDRAVRSEELEATLNYIIQNPVKAGYVSSPEEWKWLKPYSVGGTF